MENLLCYASLVYLHLCPKDRLSVRTIVYTHSFYILPSDPPGMPQNAGAIQFQLMVGQTDQQCTVLVHWSPPNNYDVRNIDRYIVSSSHGSNMEMSHMENSTLVGYLDSCSSDLHINITIIDCCGRNSSTVKLMPNAVPIERQATATPIASGSKHVVYYIYTSSHVP